MSAPEVEDLRRLAREAASLLDRGFDPSKMGVILRDKMIYQLLQAVAAVPCDWCGSPLLDEPWPRHAQCERERQERL